MKSMSVTGLIAVALLTTSASLAAPPNKGPDPSAAAVIVDANGKVVGPLVPIPFEPGTLYYGEAGAAYRVGSAVARVGFHASLDGTRWVLTRPVPVMRLYFAMGNCAGQVYGDGVPRDYVGYSTVFVTPAINLGGVQIAPARVMQQTTSVQFVVVLSRTGDDGTTCEQIVSGPRDIIAMDVVGDFPFVAPFSVK